MVSMLAAWMIVATAAFPEGTGKVGVEVRGVNLDVFTYKPDGVDKGPMLVVCHGMDRNAEDYRDHAKGMADRLGMIVIAPKFDRPRFPDEKYQRGGLFEGGKPTPQ